jgi:DNA-binding CsgD family transcriptional regulator
MKLEDDAGRLALGAMESLGIAAILCDFEGRIVAVSGPAQRLLSEGRLIAQRASVLRAVNAQSERALRAAVEQGASLQSLFRPRASAFLLRDANGVAMRVADVTPLPSSSINFRIGARLLVTIGVPTPRTKGLLTGLGLTPAEADVAHALVAGANVRDIADRRKVSIETVRAQLKAVFAKLGVRRQGELFARLRDLI